MAGTTGNRPAAAKPRSAKRVMAAMPTGRASQRSQGRYGPASGRERSQSPNRPVSSGRSARTRAVGTAFLGEVIRRADGRGVDQVVRDEITGPLGIADSLVYGIAEDMAPRLAVVVDDAPDDPPGRPPELKQIMPEAPTLTMVNRPDVLRACMPSGCTGSARALARMYAALAEGGRLDGIRLMPAERIATASTPGPDLPDALSGGRSRRALGYGAGGREFGHGGAGGSLGWAVPDHRFAFALAKNDLPVGSSTTQIVAREVRDTLGLPL